MTPLTGSVKQVTLQKVLTSRRVSVLLLVLVGITAYSGSLFVPFAMDDHNIPVIAAGDLGNILLNGGPRRITDATFALNYRFSGLSLASFHLVNLAIHLAGAITLYLLIRAIVDALTDSVDGQPPLAVAEQSLPLAVALLFVCHPLQTQAVTYIVQRYTLLATLFYLLAVLGYVNARRAAILGLSRRIIWSWGICSGSAAFLAMGSKQIAYTLPLMLVTVDFVVFRGRLFNRRLLVVCSGVAIMAALLALYLWREEGMGGFLFDLRHATAEDTTISRSSYLFTQQRVIGTYLRLLLLPVGQSLFHDYPLSATLLSPPVLGTMSLHLVLLAGAVVLLRITRKAPGPQDGSRITLLRLTALGIIWFYCTLIVESSLIPIRDVIFEHRVYLPSAGFFLALCALGGVAVTNGRRLQIAGVILALVCLTLTVLTISRNRVWSDPLLLWQESVQGAPNNSLAHANLANKLLERGQPSKAVMHYIRAFELNPNLSFRPLVDLGMALKALGIPKERFTTGQEFVMPDGGLNFGRYAEWEAVKSNNIGLAFEIMGAPDKARKRYEAAVFYRPDYDRAWFNLAILGKQCNDRELFSRAIGRLRTVNPSLAHQLE